MSTTPMPFSPIATNAIGWPGTTVMLRIVPGRLRSSDTAPLVVPIGVAARRLAML